MLNRFFDNSQKGLVLAVLLAVFFSVALRLFPFHHILMQKDSFFYNGKPILTTYDGYYYLHLSKHYWEDEYHSSALGTVGTRIRTRPLLVTLTAIINKLSGVPLEWIAYFLPVFLSASLIIVFFFWSKVYENVSIFFMSSIVGAGNLAWYVRSCLGRYDTDSLIPFFMFVIPFCSYKFSLSYDRRQKIKLGILTLLMAIVFYKWWHRALFFIPFLIAVPYVLSMFFVKTSWLGKIIRLGMVTVFIAASVSVFQGLDVSWLGDLGRQFTVVATSIKRMTLNKIGLYPSVFKGVGELTGVSFMEAVEKVSGHWAVFVFSLFGLWQAIRIKKEAILFLVVPIGLGIMGFWIRKCLIFTAPVVAFGFGFFVYETYKYATRSLKRYSSPVCGLVALLLMVLAIYPSWNTVLAPSFSPGEMAVAETLKQYPDDGPVWCWWDYGYLIEYLADKKVFVNGATQRPRRVFLSAVPFASKDPRLSANWIRFFSLRGIAGLQKISKELGSETEAISFLKQALASPGLLSVLVEKYGLPQDRDWQHFLYPEGKAYLYIPYRMLDLADLWYYFGTYVFDGDTQDKAYYRIIDGVVMLNRKRGSLRMGGRDIFLKKIYMFKLDPKPHMESWGEYNNASDLSLIFNVPFHKALIVDAKLNRTAFIQLLFEPDRTKCFESISFIPFQAGAWAVKRCGDTSATTEAMEAK